LRPMFLRSLDVDERFGMTAARAVFQQRL